MSYAIVRTDNMAGTDVRSELVSVRYMGAGGETPTEIENGHVLLLDKLLKGEREIFVGKDPKNNSPIKDVVLIATPEVLYRDDERNLDQYINIAGKNLRGYRFHEGDAFSVTYEALDGISGDPKVGNVIELQSGTKMKVATSKTSNTVIGVVEAIEMVNGKKYCVIRVRPEAAA